MGDINFRAIFTRERDAFAPFHGLTDVRKADLRQFGESRSTLDIYAPQAQNSSIGIWPSRSKASMKKRWVAIFVVTVSTPAWAVSTTLTACVTSDWTDLGAGPMTFQPSSSQCVFAIADTKPSKSPIAGFRMNQGDLPFVYTGSSHLWVYGTGEAVVAK